MAKTPETKAKDRIRDALEATCAATGWILDLDSHGGEMFSTPTVDLTGCLAHPLRVGWGIPIAIEVKRFDGKGKTTLRQLATLRRKHDAGYAVFLIDSEDALTDLLNWIRNGCPKRLPMIEDL